MAVVVFDPAGFKTRYPEFSTISDTTLTNSFNHATMFCDNSSSSPVSSITKRTMLLELLVAHVTKLFVGDNSGAPSGLIGQVTQAEEGSVSLSIAPFANMAAASVWFQQTRYGAQFWAATIGYRTMRYVASAQGIQNQTTNQPLVLGWARYGR